MISKLAVYFCPCLCSCESANTTEAKSNIIQIKSNMSDDQIQRIQNANKHLLGNSIPSPNVLSMNNRLKLMATRHSDADSDSGEDSV